MHALWQPEDFAGRQRRPHAAEYDDDECGATALMEGVGATAYGRFDATAPGKYGWDRIARQPPGGRIARLAAAAKPSCSTSCNFISETG